MNCSETDAKNSSKCFKQPLKDNVISDDTIDSFTYSKL